MQVRKGPCERCDGDGFEHVAENTVKRCTNCHGQRELATCPMCAGHCQLEGAWWQCLRCGRTYEEIKEPVL